MNFERRYRINGQKGTNLEHSLQDNNLQNNFVSVFTYHLNRFIYIYTYIYRLYYNIHIHIYIFYIISVICYYIYLCMYIIYLLYIIYIYIYIYILYLYKVRVLVNSFCMNKKKLVKNTSKDSLASTYV